MKPRQYLNVTKSLLGAFIKPNFKPQIKLIELQYLTYHCQFFIKSGSHLPKQFILLFFFPTLMHTEC